ncbi:MAG TPA: patatin-like phospholipase family protein [Pseudonocardiaceae bacterium]|nr:patatin-like phospholipase family protein [Pseudonocardiaceae bacterium]
MSAESPKADLVLAGGGVKGIGHAGAVAKLCEAGYEFPRIAGTSAGAIVGAMVAAGMTSSRIREVIKGLDWQRFRDRTLLDRIPLFGPAASVLFEYGYFEGSYVREWLGNELAALNVTTFADLRCKDWQGGDRDDDQAYQLVVMAADITRGELIRLPWDYHQYGLNPDEQLVVDAVRASISIPLFFEPVTLQHANGQSSTLVDGGIISNYPIDVFDRTDGHQPRWPTFGVTLLPRLPAANIQLFPLLGGLRRRGLPRFLESLVTTMAVGRDQGYLAKPWVQARTIEVDTTRVGIVEFDVDDADEDALYENGRRETAAFLDNWNFEAYKARFRAPHGET